MNIIVLYSFDEEPGESLSAKKVGSADKAVADALAAAGHTIFLKKYEPENVAEYAKADVVVNLCDTFENSLDEYRVAQALEKAGVAYTGCGPFALRQCIHKATAKMLFMQAGIPVAPFQLFSAADEPLNPSLQFPLIVKPVHEDASIGIDEDSVVFDEAKLRKKVQQVLTTLHQEALAEQYVDGREFCVPMIGNNQPKVLPILEIDYRTHFEGKPKILSFKAKWSKNSNAFKNTYSMLAEDVPEELRKTIERNAKKAFQAMHCSGYATVDMRADREGNVYVLEVNPNPYIATESDMAKASAAMGMDYAAFLDHLVQLAREKVKVAATVLA
ncbi:ATP-grasp domain-containing protein [Candidatus Woesearchaeota archaeon]|nr:ATP-grasp domain-containing protein [Candidatus Woesearchaeota archaeon]